LIAMINAADAHCFRVWLYPTPQRCWGGAVRAEQHVVDKSWFVEIVLPSTLTDDERRAQAIDQLRRELRGGDQ
jgi:hypothetical protein